MESCFSHSSCELSYRKIRFLNSLYSKDIFAILIILYFPLCLPPIMIMFFLGMSSTTSFEAFTSSLSFLIGCSRINYITSCILDTSLTISSSLVISNCFLIGVFNDSSGFKDANFSSSCLSGGISFIRRSIFLCLLHMSL